MNKKKPFVSLSVKMAFALILGIFLAFWICVMCIWVESSVTAYKYQSEEAVEKNLNALYDSLETYIEENDVKGTDTEALSQWIRTQNYAYISIYDNDKTTFESGWWMSEDIALEEKESQDEEAAESDQRIDEDSFTTDVYSRIIEFEDGKYYVYADFYAEYEWHRLMVIVTIILCFLTLLFTILIYNWKLLKRIGLLRSNIQKVSDGALNQQLFPLRNDELGALAVSVENMRTSIIQKHQNEKEAWEANQQLITEMSHDIRTPLTSMIGYLDIIEGKKYNNEEELDRYVSACRDKAFQLKDLSDKLFQYFLVYGTQEEKDMERFDASILLQQILMEQSAELYNQGYDVNLQFNVPDVDIKADLSGLQRLFNNIFSNLQKYADPKEKVSVYAFVEDKEVVLKIENTILEESKKVESNKIGLKTCEKICSIHGGMFSYTEEEQKFIVKISLPVAEKRTVQQEDV